MGCKVKHTVHTFVIHLICVLLIRQFLASLDHLKSTLFPKPLTSPESSPNSGHMLFRDFLREQIDNLMTGDGRDGLAEGRRGTHVEVR